MSQHSMGPHSKPISNDNKNMQADVVYGFHTVFEHSITLRLINAANTSLNRQGNQTGLLNSLTCITAGTERLLIKEISTNYLILYPDC